MTPRSPKPGVSSTWVTSQWKFGPFPGHFSTAINNHDWETALLLQALERDPFYIGAMGSKRTQAERRQRLLDAGGFPAAIDRIVGPIGIIPATRDPRTLAVSILAQVVSAYESMIPDYSSRTALV